MWPASALLTGNGVAFILRVPGTEHGNWWSTRGWWIFAGTAAVALLSKYVLRVRGRHVFNPANIGLVLCFLVLGASRAEPLDFWWGPDERMARAGARDHRGRRPRDPRATAVARDRGLVLVGLRRRAGRARGERARDDRQLAPGPGHGFPLLADPRLLARGARLPVLHDHRPEDRSSGKGSAARLCRRHRAPGDAPDRAPDDGVRDQGRAACRSGPRVRSPPASRVGVPGDRGLRLGFGARAAPHKRAGAGRSRGAHRPDSPRGEPGTDRARAGGGGHGSARSAQRLDRADGRGRSRARSRDRPPDRARPRRRPRERRRGLARA